MKIVIGSQSKDKIKVTKQSFKDLHIPAKVFGVNASSGVPDQPLDKTTTKRGAINRAENAMKANTQADLWIGLAGGLHDYGEGCHLVTFAALIDKKGREYLGSGSEIHLPREVSEKVKAGGWFGDEIRKFAEKDHLDENLVTRFTPFKEAIQTAYVEYYKQNTNIPYRNKSAAVIIDDENNFLIVQIHGYGENDWNFSGGGIEPGENPRKALKRELWEELGTDKFEILKQSKLKEQYEWPNTLIARDIAAKKSNIYRGQTVNYFLVRLAGKKSDIKPDPKEIRKYKWIKRSEFKDHFNFERQKEFTDKLIDDLLI